MKTLQELYKEDHIVAANFLDSLNLQVSIKIKGISLQVYLNEETHKYEYHTHSPELAIGPKISKLTKFFCKDITDAIDYIKDHQDVVNMYRFINLTIYNKEIYLISFMLANDTNIIDDYDSLIALANQLNIKVVPIVFKGRLTEDQQDAIKSFITMQSNLDSNQFKEQFKTIFTSTNNVNNNVANIAYMSIESFNSINPINSLVFSVNFGEKVATYKIENTQYTQFKKEEKARKELDKLQHKADYLVMTRCFVDWLDVKAQRYEESHMQSLQNNFINMCDNNKILMKLIQVATKLPVRADSKFMLQVNMLDNKIQQLIRKHGTPMRTMVEQFLLTFYKHKSTYSGVDGNDKDLIKKIDKIIDII